MIEFGRNDCVNIEEAVRREWLETNGVGGFASSTIIGLNSRRYHGLLTAALNPPVGRTALLSKLEETLIVDGERFDLSVNRYSGAVHPQGHLHLKRFKLDPFPTFTYEAANVEIEKSVFMIHGQNATAIQYYCRRLTGEAVDCRLEVRPLIAFRDFHSTTHENGSINDEIEVIEGMAVIQPYAELPRLFFAHDAIDLEKTGYWYRDFEYQIEMERGLDFKEDLFNHFNFKFDLNSKSSATIIVSTTQHEVAEAEALKRGEIHRRNALLANAGDDELIRSLTIAADQFIVARGDQKTVIAGYHWFSDWGRDTMIALPGLALSTGRYEIAKSILFEFSKHLDQGMLPNRFPDAGERPEYNTVDATLWYFEAIRACLEKTGDLQFVRDNLYRALIDIIDWHERGTRFGIRLEPDGLLFAGEPGVQLTWMDAKVGDWVVTPRTGKPVEIQALWYNALRIMESLSSACEEDKNADRFGEMAARARESFNREFWNEATGCLFDLIDGERRDGSIRPNQIFALSLHYPILDSGKAQTVLSVVEKELLTPLGLRSLAPGDPQYRPHYGGDIPSRDGAYHQGTVWPWLIGPFIEAKLKVYENSSEARSRALELVNGFRRHLREAGLGQISEVCDGDAPHTPGGCIAQAWSVAELLRVIEAFDLLP